MEFLDITDNYLKFFDILPEDWQEVIGPIWLEYSKTASIYALMDGGVIVAGGILFRSSPPNRTNFEIEKGALYVSKGYHYIGFLFVHPEHRNKALGSRWLKILKTEFPNQGFWLTIEEDALKTFYLKNEFVCVSESTDTENPEWMFVYEPVKPISKDFINL
ncbi:GNAT family N-acetyltransferase [Arenibacter certesii]|nr:GNAT family N-acetyltransferase [Arenibacter certesii]